MQTVLGGLTMYHLVKIFVADFMYM